MCKLQSDTLHCFHLYFNTGSSPGSHSEWKNGFAVKESALCLSPDQNSGKIDLKPDSTWNWDQIQVG